MYIVTRQFHDFPTLNLTIFICTINFDIFFVIVIDNCSYFCGETLKVNFYATFRMITGIKTVEFDLPNGSTIRDLINRIITKFPAFAGQLIDDQGEMFRHIHVFINGRDTYYLHEGLETILQQNEKIDIFPPVAGG